MDQYPPNKNSRLSRLDLWLIRLFMSSVYIAQKILFIMTLVDLFQEMQYLTFTIMIIFQQFLFIFSLINILTNFYHQIKITRFQRFLWEFLFFLPNSDAQDKMIVDNSAIVIIKLVFDVLNNLILLILIVICRNEKWSWIANQIVNTLMILIQYYIIESKHETFKKKISYIVTSFPLLVLLQGYVIINMRSFAIFFYIIFLFIFSLFLHLSRVLTFIRFKLEYEHQIVSPYKSFFKTFFCLVFQLSIYFKFRANHRTDTFQRKYEVFNLYSASQIIQIFILYYLDIKLNPQDQNEAYRRILHVCLISLTFYIWRVLKWSKRYIQEGPNCRNIEFDCEKGQLMSMEEIKKIYFSFSVKQRNIKIRIIKFEQEQFERIFEFLIRQNKNLSLYVKEENNNRHKLENYEMYKNKKIISIQLKSPLFTQSLLRIINENLFKNYRYFIRICSNNIQYHVFYNILLNYQLIPNLVIHSQLCNPNIFLYVNEIRKIIVYNKNIKEYMIHSPLQIYYDLFDI